MFRVGAQPAGLNEGGTVESGKNASDRRMAASPPARVSFKAIFRSSARVAQAPVQSGVLGVFIEADLSMSSNTSGLSAAGIEPEPPSVPASPATPPALFPPQIPNTPSPPHVAGASQVPHDSTDRASPQLSRFVTLPHLFSRRAQKAPSVSASQSFEGGGVTGF
jgi:hypothetical protein